MSYCFEDVLNNRNLHDHEFTLLEKLQLLISAVDQGYEAAELYIREVLLPDVIRVNFSGGRTSAYLCMLIKKYNLPVVFVYMDTGAEHPKTYDFIKQVDKFLDLNLTVIQGVFDTPLGKGNNYKTVHVESLKWDLSIWQGMMQKYSTPYFKGEFCTDRMKTGIVKAWDRNVYGTDLPCILGIRADEPRRLKLQNNIIHMGHLFPEVEKQDILDWWEEQPFNLEIPEHLGNCVFCIKKNPKKVALAIKDEPELYREFSELLRCPLIRKAPNERQQDIMYRGHLGLDGIAYLYATEDREELKDRIGKEIDTNNCSESCEAFQ
nr:phosphoadenosine phosphosulfate reductase family protein [Vibrio cholerae]